MDWFYDAGQIAGYWTMAVVLGAVIGSRVGTWTANHFEGQR